MTGPASAVTVRVPAKINLELRVGPPRADGYHDLATVFHAVGLFDEVTVMPAGDWSVTIGGPYADLVPIGEDNLVIRAGRLLAQRCGRDVTPCHIHIDKDIPVAGGMAGGSADAAAALVGLDHLWGLGGEPELLHDCAADLGSDVNFALVGGTAIGTGRGEQVVPVLAKGRYHWVLVPSPQGLSTPKVFGECDRLRGDAEVPAPEPSAAMMQALRSGDVDALGEALHNDLEPAACSLQPRLLQVLDAGREHGARGAIVSGSGPTVAFLAGSQEEALDLAVALTALGFAEDVKCATGPAQGAHVVATPRRPN